MSKRVAIVTGGNKGIGFGICQALPAMFEGGDVYLTARSVERGEEAVKKLAAEGVTVKFHQLDVCDSASIKKLR